MVTVLVAEDSPTQALEIKALLEDGGYQTEMAANGLKALEIIARAPPDIVLTDLVMPEMNGLELVEAIRRDFPAVPVILMTAHGSEEIASRALQQGAACYVPKAKLEEDIFTTLERILAVTKPERHRMHALESLAQTEYKFILHNDPELIPPIVGHLEELLGWLRLCDKTESMRVAVALQEALVNAIDHGNLEVSSELRQQDEQNYCALVAERRRQPPYRDRRVYLAAKLSPAEVVYHIRDEGPGFDPSTLPDPADPANLERIGGRGLMLIRTFMDKVFHNQSGNEITLIKHREK
jgi:CheY-like chemotaxis protein/anti-sigma regulatory factor (Ser/Thr protein kinase)